MQQELTCASSIIGTQATRTLCLAKCPLECSRSVFDVYVDYYSQSGTGNMQSFMALYSPYSPFNTPAFDGYDVDESMLVQFSANLNTLAYLQVEEEPKMSGEDLLGIVGGYLHLFLGMSLLSFVEILELAVKIVWFKKKIVVLQIRNGDDDDDKKHTPVTDSIVALKIDAVPNMVRSQPRCLSVVWLLLFIASACMCGYSFYESIEQFMSWRVTTSIQRVANEEASKMPVVTFCSMSPFTTDYAFDLVKTEMGYSPINQYYHTYGFLRKYIYCISLHFDSSLSF